MPMISPGFQKKDPAHTDFQYLEDIATAYWQSEVLFAALHLGIFKYLDQGISTLPSLATQCQINHSGELSRLLRAMERMALIGRYENEWFNTRMSSRYLVPDKPDYMGDFFLYRQNMQPNWAKLFGRLCLKDDSPEDTADASPPLKNASNEADPSNKTAAALESKAIPDHEADYKERNFRYVKAMDTLVRQKGEEIRQLLKGESLHCPVLDVGGGAGSMIRSIWPLLTRHIDPAHTDEPHLSVSFHSVEQKAVLFDLSEVIEAAKAIYPDPDQWEGIETMTGDFRSHPFDSSIDTSGDASAAFGVIILSNFLHAYGPNESRELFYKALSLLDETGMILIHDYFPDRRGRSPEKGALYDLTMMLNTYNGACHEVSTILQWLKDADFSDMRRHSDILEQVEIVDLSTDSSLIVLGGSGTINDPLTRWIVTAIQIGFTNAVPISPTDVVTAPWVRKKCECGCSKYGEKQHCPPHGMTHQETAEMLGEYTHAILLEGAPPGKEFHDMLLEMERKAFLSGYHKAFVFGAGPCTICPACPPEGICRYPDKARPAMEASGIDVYESAHRAGISLSPLKEKGQYIKYLGLLLLE